MSVTYFLNRSGNVWANNISIGYPLTYNTSYSLDVSGNIYSTGSLSLSNSSVTPLNAVSSANNPNYNLYTNTLTSTNLKIGTIQGVLFNTMNVGWNYNSGTPYGNNGLSEANYIGYTNNGIYIGTTTPPPTSLHHYIVGF